MRRVSASIEATVNSATAEAFLPGALETVTPNFLHASKSILTGPPLDTPINFKLGTCFSISSDMGAI